MVKVIKKAIKYREKLIMLLIAYLVGFIFIISPSDIVRMLNDNRERADFELNTFKIDTTINMYGAGRGNCSIYIKNMGQSKYVLHSFIADGGFLMAKIKDSVKVYFNPKRNNYVYLYEENFWQKRLIFLVFNIFYILLGFPLFYYVRKQHLKVKKLAPYGVDEYYNPLTKPEEKFKYNKYD